MRPEKKTKEREKIFPAFKKLFGFLQKKQKAQFALVLAILGISAVLSQFTPLAIGYLTDSVLAAQGGRLWSAAPLLAAILVANVLNEVLKVAAVS